MRDAVATALKVRENRTRRILDRMGFRLEKSPRRDDRATDFGLFRIVPRTACPSSEAFTMTLAEVESWIDAPPPARPSAAPRPPAPRSKNPAGRVTLHVGDCRDVLGKLPRERFAACITSPPYYWTRTNGHADQIGLEDSPADYIAALVGVFRQVRRVLHPRGTAWIVIDDSYCTRRAIRPDGKRTVARDMASGRNTLPRWRSAAADGNVLYSSRLARHGFKEKDALLLPQRLAVALHADGWYVRSEIIWQKVNMAPSPGLADRPVHAFERVLLLSRSPRYYFDPDALRERSASGGPRPGRDVWTMRTSGERGRHTSAFPVELAARCVLAGSPPGGEVVDPFAGSGSTGLAAAQHGRDATLIELSADHARTIRERLGGRLRG